MKPSLNSAILGGVTARAVGPGALSLGASGRVPCASEGCYRMCFGTRRADHALSSALGTARVA
eukprot:7328001-Prymnesium_polylepis.1